MKRYEKELAVLVMLKSHELQLQLIQVLVKGKCISESRGVTSKSLISMSISISTPGTSDHLITIAPDLIKSQTRGADRCISKPHSRAPLVSSVDQKTKTRVGGQMSIYVNVTNIIRQGVTEMILGGCRVLRWDGDVCMSVRWIGVGGGTGIREIRETFDRASIFIHSLICMKYAAHHSLNTLSGKIPRYH